MKKRIAAIVMTMALATSVFAGCGQVTGECSICGKEAPLYEVTLEMDEEEVSDVACKECSDQMQSLVDNLNELGGEAKITIKKYTGK